MCARNAFFFKKIFIYLFTWLCQVLDVARGVFISPRASLQCGPRGSRTQGPVVVAHGLSCSAACEILVPPTRDRTRIPCIGRRILNPWTTKKAPRNVLLYSKSLSLTRYPQNLDGCVHAVDFGEYLMSKGTNLPTPIVQPLPQELDLPWVPHAHRSTDF